MRDLGLERGERDRLVAVDQCVQLLERQPLGVQREQREHLGLATVEQQPLAVEPGLGRPEQGHQPGRVRRRRRTPRAWSAPTRHRGLDEACHHSRSGEPDRVGAVPGGRQVEHAELPSGDRVVHGRGPADPVVHDRRVVLALNTIAGLSSRFARSSALVPTLWSSQRPPATKLTVSALRRITRPPYVQDAGLGVGDGDDQVAVLGRYGAGRPRRGVPPSGAGSHAARRSPTRRRAAPR